MKDKLYKSNTLFSQGGSLCSSLTPHVIDSPLLKYNPNNSNTSLQECIYSLKTYTNTMRNILTKQEGKVLEMIKRFKSDEEISKELFISVHTVRTHKAKIFDKYNVHSERQLWRKEMERKEKTCFTKQYFITKF